MTSGNLTAITQARRIRANNNIPFRLIAIVLKGIYIILRMFVLHEFIRYDLCLTCCYTTFLYNVPCYLLRRHYFYQTVSVFTQEEKTTVFLQYASFVESYKARIIGFGYDNKRRLIAYLHVKW